MLIEAIRHQLSFAVRVDDHFAGTPVAEELAVELDTLERPVRNAERTGFRHADGTYRFIDLAPGPRQVRVTSPADRGFTWDPTTGVTVPVGDPREPVVIEMWPTTRAAAPPGVIAIRGVVAPATAGQDVEIEPVDTPPLGKRTRCDADGEFLFVVAGWTTVDAAIGRVRLQVNAPTTVSSVDVIEGPITLSFPGPVFEVLPGREIRVRIHLL